MPSAGGYQPTLASEMGKLQERITSTKNGSITSIQAIYVPADDLTDPAPATTFSLDVYKRQGKRNLQRLVTKVKSDLEEGNIEAVRQACDEQRGTVANVIKASLSTYSQVSSCDTLSRCV